MIGRIQEQKFSQALSGGALNISQDYVEEGRLVAIYFSASTTITETITITRTSNYGANYNCVIKTINLNGEQYAVYHPETAVVLKKGESIKVQCTNANGIGTIYGLIHFEGGVKGA